MTDRDVIVGHTATPAGCQARVPRRRAIGAGAAGRLAATAQAAPSPAWHPLRRALAIVAVALAGLAGDENALRAQTAVSPGAPGKAGEAPHAAPGGTPAPVADALAAPRGRRRIVSATLLQVQGDPPVASRAPARKRDRTVNPFDPESLRSFFED